MLFCSNNYFNFCTKIHFKKLDLENDTASILGKRVELETTSSGHYCLPLRECEVPIEHVEGVYLALVEKSDEEKEKIVMKRIVTMRVIENNGAIRYHFVRWLFTVQAWIMYFNFFTQTN